MVWVYICYKYNLKLMHNVGFPSPECSKIWIIINLRNNNIWQKFPLQTLHTGTRFQFSRKNKRICSRFRQRYYSSHQCDWIKELTLIQREVCWCTTFSPQCWSYFLIIISKLLKYTYIFFKQCIEFNIEYFKRQNLISQ